MSYIYICHIYILYMSSAYIIHPHTSAYIHNGTYDHSLKMATQTNLIKFDQNAIHVNREQNR